MPRVFTPIVVVPEALVVASPAWMGAFAMVATDELDELVAITELVTPARRLRDVQHVVISERPTVLAAAKQLGERSDRDREASVLGRSRKGAHFGICVDRARDQPAGVRLGQLVADLDEAELTACRCACQRPPVAQLVRRPRAPDRRHFVQRGNGLARSDIARVNLVVVEIVAVEEAGFVADQAVFGDRRRIELDLDLYVLGDREDRRGGVLHQNLFGLLQRVDIGRRAVAVLGDCLHHLVVEIAAPEAEHRQENAGLALLLNDALQITHDIAAALGYAHGRGVLHRDVKPENILLAGGHALMADFGLARAIGAADYQKLTETGIIVGTIFYMSPEQLKEDRGLDQRADIYSLGCILFEMLTGAPPYTGTSLKDVAMKILRAPVPSARRVRPEVPIAVDEVIAKALARPVAERFGTMQELAAILPRPR